MTMCERRFASGITLWVNIRRKNLKSKPGQAESGIRDEFAKVGQSAEKVTKRTPTKAFVNNYLGVFMSGPECGLHGGGRVDSTDARESGKCQYTTLV